VLQTSIDKGLRSAIRFAVGMCISDAFLIVVALLGVASLMEKPVVGIIVGLAGGGMLIGMGTHAFLNRFKGREIKIKTEVDEKAVGKIGKNIEQSKLPKSTTFFVKGFLLNLANPAVWFFWVFSVGLVSSQYINAKGGADIFHLTIFFTCTLVTVLATDLLKAFGAHQLKNRINDKLMANVNIVFGLILIGFGIYLIAKSAYPIFEIMQKYYQQRHI
jgi:threonine/homoserine/homoserine lactone efflux protein